MKTFPSFRSMSAAAALLAMAVNVTSTIAADKRVPTVVVAKTDGTHISYWQPAMGDGLAQMIITELNKLDNMKVLESVGLEDLREERRLGEAGEISAAEAVKKGQWKGGDSTFKSVVTRCGSKESNYGGAGGGVPIPGVRRVLPGFGGLDRKSTRLNS